MFNLKSQKTTEDIDLLRAELRAFDIFNSKNGYDIRVGDETMSAPTLQQCSTLIDSAILELKEHLFEAWQDLQQIAIKITREDGQNSGSLDNLLFLNAVKKSFELSTIFTDLKPVSDRIRQVFNVDIAAVDDRLIRHFNDAHLSIQCLHRLIMNELYRKRLVYRFMRMTKQAQISGPWANLDLPKEERVWEWDDGEEEYFTNRTQSRREQIRYNPENVAKTGFYFIWQDLNLDPYRFEDMKTDSPYKSRHLLTVP